MEEAPRPSTPTTQAPAPAKPTPAPAPDARAGGPPPIPRDWRRAHDIRVGLVTASTRLLVAGSTAWRLETRTGTRLATGDAGQRIQITRLGAGPIEVFREGELAPLWSGSPAETLLLVPAERGYAGWSGRWYRGTFRIHASRPEGLTLVNKVELESYLRGVLPSEIGNPPAGEYEAVKAQAAGRRSSPTTRETRRRRNPSGPRRPSSRT